MLSVAVFVVALLAASAASACPGCKEALAAQDPAQANIVRGYFWSILFMMSMPFLLLGSFGAYMYREVRRARARQGAQGAGDPGQAAGSQPPVATRLAAKPSEVEEFLEV